MERDPDHPQDQPSFSDHGCALLSRSTSHITFHSFGCVPFPYCWHVTLCWAGTGVLQPRPEGSMGNFRPLFTGVHAFIQSDSALQCSSHAVALHRTSAGTTSPWSLSSSLSFLVNEGNIEYGDLFKRLSILTGDLLHCVPWALCGGQNPSVCRSLLHQ